MIVFDLLISQITCYVTVSVLAYQFCMQNKISPAAALSLERECLNRYFLGPGQFYFCAEKNPSHEIQFGSPQERATVVVLLSVYPLSTPTARQGKK